MSSKPTFTRTAEQIEVERSGARLVCVEANAGAGKTTTLALCVRKQLEHGLAPSSIVLLTATEPGCQAVRAAFSRVGLLRDVARQINVQTIDDFAAKALRRIEGRVHRLDDPEHVKPHVLAAVRSARERAEKSYPGVFSLVADGELSVKYLLDQFDQFKGTLVLEREGNELRLTPGAAADLGIDWTTLFVFKAYEAARRRAWPIDAIGPRFRYRGDATYDLARTIYTGEEPWCCETHPLALSLGFIGVDEYHDINRASTVALRALLAANPEARLVGVGDVDQVIHAAHGADSYLMRAGFDAELGAATRLRLTHSFRCGSELSTMLGKFAGKPYSSRTRWPTPVDVVAARSTTDVLVVIREALGPATRRGLQPSSRHGELAVLLRRPCRHVALENQLLDNGIDYRTVGFVSYLRRPEVLFMRGLITCGLGLWSTIDDLKVRAAIVDATLLFTGRSIVTTTDGINEESVAAQRESISKLAQGRGFPGYLTDVLLKRLGGAAQQAIESAMSLAGDNRVESLAAALAALDLERLAARVIVSRADIEATMDSLKGWVQAAQSFDSIESFLRGANEREGRLAAMQNRDCIRLSTVEAAKGLEFDHVIVPGCNRGEFDGEDADERNRFYVAASRARHLLTLLHEPGCGSSYLRHCVRRSKPDPHGQAAVAEQGHSGALP